MQDQGRFMKLSKLSLWIYEWIMKIIIIGRGEWYFYWRSTRIDREYNRDERKRGASLTTVKSKMHLHQTSPDYRKHRNDTHIHTLHPEFQFRREITRSFGSFRNAFFGKSITRLQNPSRHIELTDILLTNVVMFKNRKKVSRTILKWNKEQHFAMGFFTLTHTPTPTPTHPHPLIPTHTSTHPHTPTQTHTHIHTPTHTHTPHPHPHRHTHTHTHTHTLYSFFGI